MPKKIVNKIRRLFKKSFLRPFSVIYKRIRISFKKLSKIKLAIFIKKPIVRRGMIFVAFVLILGALLFPYSTEQSTSHSVQFKIENKNSEELELGESKTLSEGSNGSYTVMTVSTGSILARVMDHLFGVGIVQEKEVSRTTTKEAQDKVVLVGKRRYQYMYCSDSSYRYYTDEQLKDESVGFTSKSEDYCKKNNQGVKVQLANAPPSKNTANNATYNSQPTYTPPFL